MKIRSAIKTVLVSGMLLAAGSVAASEIYRYVGENGNVHYRDRPTGEAGERRLAIVSRATDEGTVQAQIDARLEREAAREAARQAASGEEASAERRQEAADRAAMCQENRSRLQTYIESRRLYREDENGERVYLDGDQREAAEEKVRELIAEYCN